MTGMQGRNQIGDSLETKSREDAIHASHMLLINLLMYMIISAAELWIGTVDHSVVLIADGENNFTGIVAVISLIVGLTFSRRPSDEYHVEGHWQYKNLAVFLAGLTMFLVGVNCIWNGGNKIVAFVNGKTGSQLNGQAAYMAVVSETVMLTLAIINHIVSQRFKSTSLAASARDLFSDSLTSFGTMLAIAGAAFLHIDWIDAVAAILLGSFIIYNGSKILSDSAAKLSNGFNPRIRKEIVKNIQEVNGVRGVTFIDVRYSGSNMIIAAEIELVGEKSVSKAYQICKEIEHLLQLNFPILYCCIQVKPVKIN